MDWRDWRDWRDTRKKDPSCDSRKINGQQEALKYAQLVLRDGSQGLEMAVELFTELKRV
jgi:hypothetical protein